MGQRYQPDTKGAAAIWAAEDQAIFVS